MAKEAPAPRSQRAENGKASRSSGVGLIPSRTWLDGARAIWSDLSFRERGLFLLGILLPVLDKIASLCSLSVTMRAVSYGIRKPLDLEMRLWLGLTILVATLLSEFIMVLSNRVKKGLKVQNTRLVRRMYGAMMVQAARLPSEKRRERLQQLINEERNFISSAVSGLSDSVEFLASIFLVTVLLGLLTWFKWQVGVVLFAAILIALLVLRWRLAHKSPQRENTDAEEAERINAARKEVGQKLMAIGARSGNAKQLIEEYANNDYDRLTLELPEQRKRVQKRIASAMNFGSAGLMTLVFFLVSAQGAFDESRIVWMVVFVFGMRMAVTNAKNAMVLWGDVLQEKHSLMQLARAGLIARSNAGLDEGRMEPEESEEDENGYGSVVRIVEYSIHGLNGTDLVSREPMVVELTVESKEEVYGFYWSFSIVRTPGSPFILSKMSLDSGITWDLPKGRSTFRVVTGPLWLPAGSYYAMLGAASGDVLMDLVGEVDKPIPLEVHPDEIAKRSPQKRIAPDVVIIDVEWDQDFKHEAQSPPVAQAAPSATTTNS